MPSDPVTRTLLAVLAVAVLFLLVAVALVIVTGRPVRHLDDPDAALTLGIWDDDAPFLPRPDDGARPAALDRLAAQVTSLDLGLQHYPCRPDQACDLHDTGTCAVTRCCPSCSTNPVRRGA